MTSWLGAILIGSIWLGRATLGVVNGNCRAGSGKNGLVDLFVAVWRGVVFGFLSYPGYVCSSALAVAWVACSRAVLLLWVYVYPGRGVCGVGLNSVPVDVLKCVGSPVDRGVLSTPSC
jgi:hypothetical protein